MMNNVISNRLQGIFRRRRSNQLDQNVIRTEPETNQLEDEQQRSREQLANMIEDPRSFEFTETIRDVMIQMIFYGFTERYVECYSKFVRKFIEYSLLLQACICFSLLCQVHYAYILHPMNCFPELGGHLNKHTLIKVQINDDRNFVELNLNTPKLFDENYFNVINNLENMFFNNDEDLEKDDDEKKVHPNHIEYLYGFSSNTSSHCSIYPEDNTPPLDSDQKRVLQMMNQVLNLPYAIFYYSFRVYMNLHELVFSLKERRASTVDFTTEEALLHLPQDTIEQFNITTIHVHLNPLTNECFGSSTFRRVFMYEMFSSLDIIMVSYERLLSQNGFTNGYFKLDGGVVERVMLPSDFNLKFYAINIFKMLFFVLFISTILKNMYNSFLNIFVEVTTGLTFSLNAFIHICLSFVGVYGLRHFSIKLVRQYWVVVFVVFLIWFAEQYFTICCRTRFSKRHWPRFFFLYFFAFYTYYLHFNAKFRFLVFLTKWLFIQHSMFFFFHRFELPTMMNTFRHHNNNNNNNNNNNSSAESSSDGSDDDDDDNVDLNNNSNEQQNRNNIQRIY